MYHQFTLEALRTECRNSIESFEIWARRLIHQRMTEQFGINYIEYQNNGTPLFNKTIRTHVRQMIDKEPSRFSRPVDTLSLEDIIFILCNRNWYKDLFKEALDYNYPQGCDEANEYLSRLIPIRNALAHANPISIHQVEQAICYSHDFIEGLKAYYRAKGVERMWNVPRIIRYSDSLGNSDDNPTDNRGIYSGKSIITPFHCGDRYSINIEVDPSFEKSSYKIIWTNQNEEIKEFNNSEVFSITFRPQDTAENHFIYCRIISNQDWHKYGQYDCEVTWHFTVLPPM